MQRRQRIFWENKRKSVKKELASDGSVADNRHYFDGMKIMEAGEEYLGHMGRYPVISMSLKSARQPDYHMSYESLVDEIIKEYVRHSYILDSDCLTEEYHERYYAIMNRRAEPIAYAKSITILIDYLKNYNKSKDLIIL